MSGAKAMDKRLVEAARVGDVVALHKLMEEDPQILKKACLARLAESPLHVATLADQVDFVEEIINRKPSLATLPNQKGLIPLHMASEAEHVEIVKELLKAKLGKVNQCLLKDEDGWTPLHYAVSSGRVDVIQELIEHCPECVQQVTAKGESALHLAVKSNQFEAVEVLVEKMKTLPNFQTLFGAKDNNHKTVYELAAAKKQFQVILDIRKEDEKDDIKEENGVSVDIEDGDPKAPENKEEEALGEYATAEAKKDQKNNIEEAILVVATLIITLTYQGLLNPPSTLFEQGTEIDWECLFGHSSQKEGSGMLNFMKNCPALLAFMFLIMNTLIYVTSINIVATTLRGRPSLPLRLLMGFLTICYSILLMAFSRYTAYVALPLGFGAIYYQFEDISRYDSVPLREWIQGEFRQGVWFEHLRARFGACIDDFHFSAVGLRVWFERLRASFGASLHPMRVADMATRRPFIYPII